MNTFGILFICFTMTLFLTKNSMHDKLTSLVCLDSNHQPVRLGLFLPILNWQQQTMLTYQLL